MENAPIQKQSDAPFKGELIDSNVSEFHLETGKLREIQDNPKKVIRKESFDLLHHRYGNAVEVFDAVRIVKTLFDELSTTYNIEVPASFVIGEDMGGNKMVFSVADKIEGQKWEDLTTSKEAEEQLQKLYTSLARYYVDKLKEGGFYLTDIANETQYVYGKKSDDTEDKLYLVDTDIYFNGSRAGMYTTVEWLTRHMKGNERNFDTVFETARNYIQEFLTQPLPEGMTEKEKERVDKNIEGIRKFLDNEKLGEGPIPAIPPFERPR